MCSWQCEDQHVRICQYDHEEQPEEPTRSEVVFGEAEGETRSPDTEETH